MGDTLSEVKNTPNSNNVSQDMVDEKQHMVDKYQNAPLEVLKADPKMIFSYHSKEIYRSFIDYILSSWS